MPDSDDGRFPAPEEAMRFLEGKVNVETENWDDLKWGEHAYAFTVAHSMNAGVLDTIHGYLNQCMREGKSFDEFRDSMLDFMASKKWYGGAGHTADEKAYKNWRIGVIYDTNMRTAYASARYRRQLQSADLRPIWVYHHDPNVKKPRVAHLALDGRAYRYDDPFWDTYYPLNGWGCQCYVTTESEAEAKRKGIEVGDSTGESGLPEIDDTWAYNVGRETLAPNFDKFTHLTPQIIDTIRDHYRADMEKTKLTAGELRKIIEEAGRQKPEREAEDEENKPILYLIGSLDADRQDAMEIDDCKIMINFYRVFHAFIDKNPKQQIDVTQKEFLELYNLIQKPDEIWLNTNANQKQYGTEFHFSKKHPTVANRILNVVLRKQEGCALQIITLGRVGDDHANKNFRRLWPKEK
jgi:hypothetical protein